MKKFVIYTISVLFVSAMSLVGMGNTSWLGSDANAATKMGTAAEQAMPAGEHLTMSGKINENSQFVDNKGEVFNLADNEKGMEVKSMSGMKVQIKGTVMEKEGKKVIDVTEYNVLK